MRFQLSYRSYRRKFKSPTRLGSSIASEREGIVVRLIDDEGRMGFGEVAPIESFGSESVLKAKSMLDSFCGVIRSEAIEQLDYQNFPCLSYALHMAMKSIRKSLDHGLGNSRKVIPAGLFSIDQDPSTVDFSKSLVWKIKITNPDHDLKSEQLRLEPWLRQAHELQIHLRLDANEQLTLEEAKRWIEFLEPHCEVVEYLEQPLDRWAWEEIRELVETGFPIALDESVSLLRNQSQDLDWLKEVALVVKPSLGDLYRFEPDVWSAEKIILSSVFETAFGFSSLFEHPYFERIAGFDTQGRLELEFLDYPKSEDGSFDANSVNLEQLWKEWGETN